MDFPELNLLLEVLEMVEIPPFFFEKVVVKMIILWLTGPVVTAH